MQRVRKTGSSSEPGRRSAVIASPCWRVTRRYLRELTRQSQVGITLEPRSGRRLLIPRYRGVEVSLTTIWSTLRESWACLTKKVTEGGKEQDRPDVAVLTRSRWSRVAALHGPSAAFVFLDETGASTNMVRRLYGWGPRGRAPGRCSTPHGHWRDHHLRRRPAGDRHHRPARAGQSYDTARAFLRLCAKQFLVAEPCPAATSS